MKTIGIIGGLSPESTAVYYTALNREIRTRTNGAHNARIVMVSVDGGEIWALRQKDDWDGQGNILADAARTLETAGADFILLAGNTMHRMAHAIEAAITVPFLHLLDITAKAITSAEVTRVGLTGTVFSMTGDFYKERLARHGIETLVPEADEINALDRMIYKELCLGTVNENSRQEFGTIINHLAERGAGGVILGCTELTLYTPLDAPVPLFDTARLHIDAALEMALA